MRIPRARRGAARGAACLLFACAPGLAGQGVGAVEASGADVAIAQGRLEDAERALYAASAAAPREPAARGALGMFLASRGRLKVGAVLLEEARQFGGDARVIDGRLARIYAWLGDWAAVAGLVQYAAPGAERDRVRWLAAHAPGHGGPDSVAIALEPNEAAGFGRVALTIGGATLLADIDPNVTGLVLPSTPEVAAASQQFGMSGGVAQAVVLEVSIGAMRLSNVPAALTPGASPAIGLDVLAAFTPTVDAGSHRITLRLHAAATPGDSLPFLLGLPGVRLVARAGQPPVAMQSAAGRAALRGAPWTFDLRRGVIEMRR